MNHIDLKYATILSSRLELFKIKQHNPFRANFRCPICGDSQKSKTKARGWILEKDNSALFYCHNCGASLHIRNLLKAVDTALYNDYVVDSMLDKPKPKEKLDKIKPLDKLTKRRPKFEKKGSPLKSIKKVSSLPANHSCRKYIAQRQIPANTHYRMYYAPKFTEWVNSLIPNKMQVHENDHPRLVFPFIDKKGNVFGFNARAFDKNQLRYITIMLDEEQPKMFGMNELVSTKKYYVVEGPIDSLFIENSVAMAGADGNSSKLPNPENAVFVFDNEPRNKEIVRRMSKCVEKGHNICIWPDKLVDKDINDMILSGITPREVQEIINANTYRGLEANLKLSYWRKC